MWSVQQSIRDPLGVTVFGSSLIRTEPDVAEASIAVRRIAKEPSESFSATRAAVQSVREALAKAGIESNAIEVSRVAVEDAFEGFGPTQKFLGYRSSVTFRIRIGDVDLVERVLVAVVAAGADRIDRVTYQASNLRELRAQARRNAVAAARQKADVYCDAAGCKLGRVMHIEDVDPERAMQSTGHLRGPTSQPDVDDAGALGSGSLTVAGAVMIVYALLPSD